MTLEINILKYYNGVNNLNGTSDRYCSQYLEILAYLHLLLWKRLRDPRDTSLPGYVHAEEGTVIFPAKACCYIYVPAYCFNSCKMYSIYYYPELKILKKEKKVGQIYFFPFVLLLPQFIKSIKSI